MSNRVISKIDGLDEVLQGLNPELANSVARGTLDKLGRLSFTQVKKEIAGSYNIKQKDMDLVYSPAIRNNNPVAYISAPIRQKSLINFKTMQSWYGVYAEVKKGHLTFFSSAFKATTTNFKGSSGRSYTNVFRRVGRNRFPLKSLYGVSIGLLLTTKNWLDDIIQNVFNENGQRILESEFKYRVSKFLKLR